MSLKIIPDPNAAMEFINDGSASVIFADTSSLEQYNLLESAIQSSVGMFSDKINANSIHFISSHDLEDVRYLIQSPIFGNFILRNYGNIKESGAHYGNIIKASLGDRGFGLKNLISSVAKVQVIKLQVSTQKQQAVEAIRSYLVTAKFNTRMAAMIANAVDELIMNAVYAAPTDELGKPLLTTTSRNSVIKLEGKGVVEAHIAFDGKFVAVSAIDHYGSLDKAKLLTHISKIYTQEAYKVKATSAGAGIGLATIFKTGGSFFFASEQGSRTEVTVFFRKYDSYREFKEQFRFISTQFYF